MPRTVAELVADLDAVTEELDQYRDRLRDRKLVHAYTGDAVSPEEEVSSLRLPVRPPVLSHAPRPPGLGQSIVLTPSPESGPSMGSVMACAQPDWLCHLVTVQGPSGRLAQFRAQAAGPGRIPWAADVFSPDDLIRPFLTSATTRDTGRLRPLAEDVAGAAERVRVRDEGLASAPFDLNALCPVPLDLLALGPQSPEAKDWLLRHWGTTRPLRQVDVVRSDPADDTWTVSFWSADWTPWAALRTIAGDWPDLCVRIRPLYDV